MWALHYNLGQPVASQIDPLILKVLVLFVHKEAKISNVSEKDDNKKSKDDDKKSVSTAKDILHRFVEDAMTWDKESKDKAEVSIFHYDARASRWRLVSTKRGRPLHSVFLPDVVKSKVVDDMKRFLSARSVKWYHRHGVPYKRSYCFYGPPGSGKTSFIQALAHKFERKLCFLQPSSPQFTDDSLMIAIQSTPMNSIIVLEDIDALFTKNRDSKSHQMTITFSGLLNALDGMANPDGQIFVLTTNHIDRLDSALIRHGRVDLRVEFSTATDEQLKGIFDAFLNDGDAAEVVSGLEIKVEDNNNNKAGENENDSVDNEPENSNDKKEEKELEKETSKQSDDSFPESEFTPLSPEEQEQARTDWVKAWRKQFKKGVPMATVQTLCISQMGKSPRSLIEAIKELKEYEQDHSGDGNNSSFYM